MQHVASEGRNILVFGGNGLLGATVVEKLLDVGDHVTIVNRGNWYWDSQTRILPHVTHIKCDRTREVSPCAELETLVNATDTFDAVFDFSSYGPEETRVAIALLKDKVGLYVLISTDSIYDVCYHEVREKPAVEDEDVRPKNEETRDLLNKHHINGHRKLQSEEELKKQRDQDDGGFPYVILRLPDVIGPRDTTYRFWVYQLWIKLAPHFRQHPVMVPYFLKDYALSFVYVDDVAKAAVDLLHKDPEVYDEAYNLAWQETSTLEQLLRTMENELEPERHQGFNIDEKGTTNYFYPSIRRGPVSVEKAMRLLNWQPTPMRQAIRESVAFYENAMKDELFRKQRNEIVQIVQTQLFNNDSTEFFQTLEKIYGIDLHQFLSKKDEL